MIRHGFTSHFLVQADRVGVGAPLRGKHDGEYDPSSYPVKTAKRDPQALGIQFQVEAART